MAQLTTATGDLADAVPDQKQDTYAQAAPVKTILSKGLSPDLFMPPPPETEHEDEHKPTGMAREQEHRKLLRSLPASAKAKIPTKHPGLDQPHAEAQSKRKHEEDDRQASASAAAERWTLIGREAVAGVYEDFEEVWWTLIEVRKADAGGRARGGKQTSGR